MDNDVLKQLLVLVVIPVLSAAAAYIIAWFKAKTQEIKKRTENEIIMHNLEILDKTVLDVVNTMNQTMVEKLKQEKEDGKLSDEDIEKIKLEALKYTYTILGESVVLILKNVTSDLDCLICSKIESTLYKMKNDMEKRVG
ncbi:MAG: hypothetical protein ACM3TR_13480 [Caulobacteraceae bacterium]